jgi:hypothetical protein
MNLEDYFNMLHNMAQKHPQSPSGNHGIMSNHHKTDDISDEDEDPLPPEDIAET